MTGNSRRKPLTSGMGRFRSLGAIGTYLEDAPDGHWIVHSFFKTEEAALEALRDYPGKD